MSHYVVHFEVIGKDGKRLHEFYRQLFGWKITVDNPINYGQVAAADAGVGGAIGETQEGHGGYVTFYVTVPDLTAALEKVGQLGGKTLFGPAEVAPGIEIAHFADPEGHRIGLLRG